MKNEEPMILIPWLNGGGSVWMDVKLDAEIPETINAMEDYIKNGRSREGKLFNSDQELCNWIKNSEDVLPDQRFIILFNGSANRFNKLPRTPFSVIAVQFNMISKLLFPTMFVHPSKQNKPIKLDTIMNVRINKKPLKLIYDYICPLCYENSGNRMTVNTNTQLSTTRKKKKHSICQRCGHEFITSNCLEVVDFDVDNQ